MTGEELYQLYVDAYEQRGCIVDSWDWLGDEQEVWNEIADGLENKNE